MIKLNGTKLQISSQQQENKSKPFLTDGSKRIKLEYRIDHSLPYHKYTSALNILNFKEA